MSFKDWVIVCSVIFIVIVGEFLVFVRFKSNNYECSKIERVYVEVVY